MKVFQQDQEGKPGRQGLEVVAQVNQSPVTELFGVVQHPCQVGAVPEFKAHQVPHEVGSLLAIFPSPQRHAHPSFQLLPHHRRRVAVLNLETEGKQIPHQAVGQVPHLLPGAPLEVVESLRQQFGPEVKLIQQAGLAHPRLAGDGHHLALAVFHGGVEGVLQPLQFRFPADHARLDALHAANTLV